MVVIESPLSVEREIATFRREEGYCGGPVQH